MRRAGFPHAFTTRADDADFQVKPGDPASRARVDGLVGRLAEGVGFDPGALYEVTQVHGARVVVAGGDREQIRREEADALVVFPSESRRAVGVRTADCVPILVADARTGSAAAIHAGWRGLVRGVIPAGVAAMRFDYTSALGAAIGPCIGPCCFEVGADVAEQIVAACGDPRAVARREGDKAYVDLRRAVRAQLRSFGLDDELIEDIPGCTRCDATRFHSFRRDGAASGRMIAVIAPKTS